MALLHEINNGTQRLSVSSTGQVKINNAFTFPTADGTENYVLKTDGSGTVNWQPDANTGTVTGTGTENKVVRWNATAGEIGNGPITFSSNAATASSTFAGPLFIKTNDDPTLTLENTDDSGNPVITFKSNTLITVEGAQLFYVNSVGAFHITTTYPNNAAAIVFNTGTGTDQGTNNERMRITGNGAIEIKGSSTTASAQAFITNDNSLLSIGSSVSGSVVKDIQFSSPSAMMYIEGATGNVGIGTVSPSDLYADQLVVKCSSSENGITILSNSTTDANYLMFADGTSGSDRFRGQIKYNHQSNFMAFGTDAVEKMRISSTGLTTIKRTGITGAAKADMTLQIGFEGNDGQNNLIGFGYNGGTNIPAYIGYSSTSGSENTKGDLYFATRSVTTDTQPTNRMVVKASGDVGIGTAEPDSLLNVESASINTAILTLGCTKNDDSWTLGDKIGAVNFFSADTSGPGALVRGSMALVAEAASGEDMGLSFSTYNNTERVRITATGRMGIGTTTPNAKLEVTSGQAKTVTSGVEFARFGTSNEASNYATLTGEVKGGAAAADRKWIFQTIEAGVANAGNIAFQPSGGNVGIGTDSPNAPFDVTSKTSGTSGVQQWSYNSAPSSYRLQLNTIVSSGLVKFSFDQLNAGAAYNNALVFDRGKIGIGDTEPAYRLSVTGSLDERVQINSTANKTAGIYMRVLSSGTQVGTGTIATQNNGQMQFFTGTSGEAVAMTLDTDGRLQDTSGIYLGSNNNVNLLNYYASDTWTPIVITSQGTSPGINSASGRWQRVGKVVTASFEFTMNNPAVGAGIVVINNLPVAIADTDHVSGCGSINDLGQTINVRHYTASNQIGMNFYDGNYCGTQYRTVGTVTYWAAT